MTEGETEGRRRKEKEGEGRVRGSGGHWRDEAVREEIIERVDEVVLEKKGWRKR